MEKQLRLTSIRARSRVNRKEITRGCRTKVCSQKAFKIGSLRGARLNLAGLPVLVVQAGNSHMIYGFGEERGSGDIALNADYAQSSLKIHFE